MTYRKHCTDGAGMFIFQACLIVLTNMRHINLIEKINLIASSIVFSFFSFDCTDGCFSILVT